MARGPLIFKTARLVKARLVAPEVVISEMGLFGIRPAWFPTGSHVYAYCYLLPATSSVPLHLLALPTHSISFIRLHPHLIETSAIAAYSEHIPKPILQPPPPQNPRWKLVLGNQGNLIPYRRYRRTPRRNHLRLCVYMVASIAHPLT